MRVISVENPPGKNGCGGPTGPFISTTSDKLSDRNFPSCRVSSDIVARTNQNDGEGQSMKNKCLLVLTLVLASIVVTSCSAQNRPSADTFKQVLNQKLQALRPTGWTERNVLLSLIH